jgi:tetratricopeptide (TPR) repeat protein
MNRSVLGLALGAALSIGCSRAPIEAVNLSNDGDKLKSSNIDEAISKYEQAVQLDPSNHRILWKLAEGYRKKEQWDKVATTSVKAQKLAPTFANYYFEQGLAMARQAEKGPTSWAEAKQPLEEAIQKDPNIADAHFELAEVLLHMDDEQGALKEYTKAIQVKPDQLIFYSVLADLYQRLGFVEQADAVLKEGVSFGKEGDKALFNLHTLLGVSADLKGRADEGLKEYELAKKACGACNESGQQIAFFNYGVALAQSKRPNEAVAQLQSFYKMICKGGAQARYKDECAQAQEVARKNNGTLQ